MAVSRRLEFHPAVPSEIEAIELWHEIKQRGLGTRFRDDIAATFETIRDHPEHFAKSERDIRMTRLMIFSYVVRFRWLDDRIRIVSVKHSSQGPGRWQSRQ